MIFFFLFRKTQHGNLLWNESIENSEKIDLRSWVVVIVVVIFVVLHVYIPGFMVIMSNMEGEKIKKVYMQNFLLQ